MGQVVKQIGPETTRYYWYPGNKKEWLRAGVSLVLGGAAYLTLNLLSGAVLIPAVVGITVTTTLTGMNFGRRESRETRELYEAVAAADGYATRALRRKAAIHSGHALWRRVMEVGGAALAAIVLVNIHGHGFVSGWLLPLVPALFAALGHQAGVAYERLGHSRTIASTAKKNLPPGMPGRQRVAGKSNVDHIG